MPYLVLDGTGTYMVKDVKLRPGANPIDDPEIIEWAKSDKCPPWITIQESREAPVTPTPAPEPPKPKDPFMVYRGRDGKWFYLPPAAEGADAAQSDPFETEEEAQAAADAAREAEESKVPLAGTVPSPQESGGKIEVEDLKKTKFSCDECDKVCSNKSALINHKRIMHPKKPPLPA